MGSEQTAHSCFTVSSTAYLRNLSPEDRREECIAVYYQRPPEKVDAGLSLGLKFPAFIVTGYLENPEAVAEKVAKILEKHWDDEDDHA